MDVSPGDVSPGDGATAKLLVNQPARAREGPGGFVKYEVSMQHIFSRPLRCKVVLLVAAGNDLLQAVPGTRWIRFTDTSGIQT